MRGRVRHVDRLGDGPGDERLGRGHHADVRLGRQEALAGLAAAVGAIEDRIVLRLQMRGPLDGHGAAHVVVGLGDLGLREAERGQKIGGDFRSLKTSEVLSSLMPSLPVTKSSPRVQRLKTKDRSNAAGS